MLIGPSHEIVTAQAILHADEDGSPGLKDAVDFPEHAFLAGNRFTGPTRANPDPFEYAHYRDEIAGVVAEGQISPVRMNRGDVLQPLASCSRRRYRDARG